MSLTTELEKELKIYSLMQDLNVPQVLSTQQVTTLPSFSESGAREHAAVGRQLQRAPQKHTVSLWPLCVTKVLTQYPMVAVKYSFTAYKSKTFSSAAFL